MKCDPSLALQESPHHYLLTDARLKEAPEGYAWYRCARCGRRKMARPERVDKWMAYWAERELEEQGETYSNLLAMLDDRLTEENSLTVDCDLIRCEGMPHFFPWEPGRPIPRACPLDGSALVLHLPNTWSMRYAYNGARKLFGITRSNQ